MGCNFVIQVPEFDDIDNLKLQLLERQNLDMIDQFYLNAEENMKKILRMNKNLEQAVINFKLEIGPLGSSISYYLLAYLIALLMQNNDPHDLELNFLDHLPGFTIDQSKVSNEDYKKYKRWQDLGNQIVKDLDELKALQREILLQIDRAWVIPDELLKYAYDTNLGIVDFMQPTESISVQNAMLLEKSGEALNVLIQLMYSGIHEVTFAINTLSTPLGMNSLFRLAELARERSCQSTYDVMQHLKEELDSAVKKGSEEFLKTASQQNLNFYNNLDQIKHILNYPPSQFQKTNNINQSQFQNFLQINYKSI